MGVDFVLDRSCPVKEKLGTEGLVGLVKSRSRAESILQMSRKDGNTKPPSEIHITLAVITPQGTQEKRSVSVQSLLDESAPLDQLAPNCKTCPANLRGPAFGCYGTINYPIRASTEQWLMGFLPDDLESTAGLILQRAVKDLGYDGSPILRLRSQKTFFEDQRGQTRTWKGKGFFGRMSGAFSITSSQLLQMLFCLGPLQPSHCAMVGLFLGLIPHDSPAEALKNKAIFEKAASNFASRIRVPADDAGATNFFHLFQALVGAVLLDVPVLVDY